MHLQAAGMPVLSQDTIPLVKRTNGKGITGYVRNGRLIGIVGRDNPRGMLHWTAELQRELRRSETLTNPPMRAFGQEQLTQWDPSVEELNAMYAN
jgi:hypothetical protein